MTSLFFFFTHPPPTYIYTLSLHDALPIFRLNSPPVIFCNKRMTRNKRAKRKMASAVMGILPSRSSQPPPLRKYPHLSGARRSEEHTSELQSPMYLVCRLLLEKKKKPNKHT